MPGNPAVAIINDSLSRAIFVDAALGVPVFAAASGLRGNRSPAGRADIVVAGHPPARAVARSCLPLESVARPPGSPCPVPTGRQKAADMLTICSVALSSTARASGVWPWNARGTIMSK